MLEPGAAVPAVTVADSSGATRPLHDHLDRPTLLVFLKDGCETTRIALPVYAAWRRHEPEVRVLAISQDDPGATARMFSDLGVDVPVAFDAAPYPASAAFDLPGVPAAFLVLGGEVVFSTAGWYREAAAELAGEIATLAGEEPFLDVADDVPIFRPG